MSALNLTLTFSSITKITQMFLDILIMWLLIYYAIKLIRNNSRTVQIFKGILFVLIVNLLARILGLSTVQYIADLFINWGFLAIIIVFQPEIRQILERLGKSTLFSKLSNLSGNEKEKLVDEVVKATMLLSQNQTGALISIEQGHSLSDFIDTGTPLNSTVTAELLTSIFVTTTPLHDGAVIIQGNSIACASAYFPPTNLELPSKYGARHRAAIGISEITDCVTIVVSEETGTISIAQGGKIFAVNHKQLRNYLLRVICGYTTEVTGIVVDDNVEHAKAVKEFTKEQEKSEQIEKQDTSMFSKLSLKKQTEKTHSKIDAEEIVDNRRIQKTDTTLKNSEEDEMNKLDAQKNNIKLPHHKKAAPIIDYNNPPQGNYTKANDEIRQGVYKSTPSQRNVNSASVSDQNVNSNQTANKPVYRRSENIQAMGTGTAETAKPEAKTEKTAEPVKREEIKQTVPENRNNAQSYDTSNIDLSRLMGLGNDLDHTFDLLDHPTMDASKKGGKK